MQKSVNLVDLVKSFPIFIFQTLSTSLFLNLLFEPDPYSNEYLLAKIDVNLAKIDRG